MQETKQARRHPSPFQIVVGVLLIALLVSNVQLRGQVEALQTEMNERFDDTTASITGTIESIASTADTISVLQQATMMNVSNRDDFLSLLEENAERTGRGTSPLMAYFERIEPVRVPQWLLRYADELSDYEVKPCYVHKNADGGSTTYYGSALQPSEGNYELVAADQYRVSIDLGSLTINPYGIFEGNIYVLYDDGTDGRSSGRISIYIHNQTDNTGHKVVIPFTHASENIGLKFDNRSGLWSVASRGGGKIELIFSVSYDGEVPEVYAIREIGTNMIGNVIAYSRSAYDGLPI